MSSLKFSLSNHLNPNVFNRKKKTKPLRNAMKLKGWLMAEVEINGQVDVTAIQVVRSVRSM